MDHIGGESAVDQSQGDRGEGKVFGGAEVEVRLPAGRPGGGGLGNEHIFGRSAISPGGMTALYEYVQSLK